MTFSFASHTTQRLASVKDKIEKRIDLGPTLTMLLGTLPIRGKILLLAGEPGSGKSTLLLHALLDCPAGGLYVSCEESIESVAARARRIGKIAKNIHITAEAHTHKIARLMRGHALVIVDSINVLKIDSSFPLTDGTKILCKAAQKAGVFLCIIGHVNRDGDISGPKAVEHLVDAVGEVLVEGEGEDEKRTVKLRKNRLGKTGRTTSYTMTEKGMVIAVEGEGAPVKKPRAKKKASAA